MLGDGVAKWTLRRFDVEMTGAWLETDADRVESRAELRHRLGALLDRGNLSEERKAEIINAFTVGEIPVSEVMTPRSEIVFLSTDAAIEENIERIGASPHTRFPLVGADPTDYRGIVYVPAVVGRIDELRSGESTFEDIAADPMTLQSDTHISDAVDAFQNEHQELALVCAEDDENVRGLVTATDALEAVMGEIEDPLDIERRERTADAA